MRRSTTRQWVRGGNSSKIVLTPGRVAPSKKRKASSDAPPEVMTKWVRVVSHTINLEEELEAVSGLLERIRDEAVEVEQRVRAMESCVWDTEGWVWDLRRRVREAHQKM